MAQNQKPAGGTEPDGTGALEQKIPIVTSGHQPKCFKVVQIGYTVLVDGEVPEFYRFQYTPSSEASDGFSAEAMEPGVIPANYSAMIPVKGDDPMNDTYIYFSTKEGHGYQSLGPLYQVAYDTPQNVLVDWTEDIDGLWSEAIGALEDHGDVTEEGLDMLDCDPLWLFGIADADTQRILERASKVPMLQCTGQRPTSLEWFGYINADSHMDADFTWVVEAFSDVELPVPWVSYKGVGNVICFLNEETNDTTWKHPFYDYFAQLLDHCRRATFEEHIKLRLNRLLWSFEADCALNIEVQQPLVSPKYIAQIAAIFKINLKVEPGLARILKTFLRVFSQQYQREDEISDVEIRYSLEIVENERKKLEFTKTLKASDVDKENKVAPEEDPINPHVHAQVFCTDCGKLGTHFCTDCQDPYCEECFERMHSKGQRRKHTFNYINPCTHCQVFPAKLQCTYSFGLFCHECYARKHVKTLPRYLDLRPVKVDYRVVGGASGFGATITKQREVKVDKGMGECWHGFYDMRGSEFYHNFEEDSYMRRQQKIEPKKTFKSERSEWNCTNLAQSKDARKLRVFSKLTRDLPETDQHPKKHRSTKTKARVTDVSASFMNPVSPMI
jgi:hypothetical protein